MTASPGATATDAPDAATPRSPWRPAPRRPLALALTAALLSLIHI